MNNFTVAQLLFIQHISIVLTANFQRCICNLVSFCFLHFSVVLCPSEWLKYQGKCYWFSNEMKSWSDSYVYCLERKSHLLIIQDQLEMAFIQKNLRQSNHVWIGLNFTSLKMTWTWVDGSPVDPEIFFIKGPAKENRCAAIRASNIYSETCSSVFKWICQY
ncbi:killer cell lectin-like receptor subfamily F member 1 [Cebus imitator]|uniref:C-type lectin domain-containing protein n=1 Tax=Cebus imitator TaxID=2715852 RepID=A0A2K5RST2_CEBIM|nr:killer cell lectin-like receptor subfamily F member 1 [Cebus imitator]